MAITATISLRSAITAVLRFVTVRFARSSGSAPAQAETSVVTIRSALARSGTASTANGMPDVGRVSAGTSISAAFSSGLSMVGRYARAGTSAQSCSGTAAEKARFLFDEGGRNMLDQSGKTLIGVS